MNINIAREQNKQLVIDNNNFSSEVKINRNTEEPSEKMDDSLRYLMNNDARNKLYEEPKVDIEEESQCSDNSLDTNSNNSDGVSENNFDGEGDDDSSEKEPEMTYEEMEREKVKYLIKLKRLNKNSNIPIRKLDMSYSLKEIKTAVMEIEREIEIENGIEYYKFGLKFMTWSMETGTSTFMKSNALDGYSQFMSSQIENNNNYDAVLSEIYEIWGGGSMRPEAKLAMMLGQSSYMFHMQKLMAERKHNSNYRNHGSTQMKGPSEDTDEILKRLAEEELSETSSVDEPVVSQKKRGRPKKNK